MSRRAVLARLTRVVRAAGGTTLAMALGLGLIALVALYTVPVLAQQGGPDYAAWDLRATQAEATLERDQASIAALEVMRTQLAEWRDTFLTTQDDAASRLSVISAQIEALGPVPETGEAAEIATRRAELESQLADLRAPVLRADEAFARADGLISEVDTLIRARQTATLLELGPTPLDPTLWPKAATDLSHSFERARREVAAALTSDVARAEARSSLPLVAGLGLIGILLIVQGAHWARRAVSLLRGDSGRGGGVWRFLVSLGQIGLPLLGITALVQAIEASGFLGAHLASLLAQVPLWAALLLGLRWIADRTLNEDDRVASLDLAPRARARAARLGWWMALVLTLEQILGAIVAQEGYAAGTFAVLNFPLLAVAGFLLAQTGLVLRSSLSEGGQDSLRYSLARLSGRAALALGLAGPFLAAVGYANLGAALVYPAIATLALFGLLLVVQGFFNSLYRMITGTRAAEADTLAPVLAGFLLIMAALPVLALIWGARPADLSELWITTREGVAIGNGRLRPTDLLLGMAVISLGIMTTRLVQGALRTTVLPRTRLDEGGRSAVVAGTGYLGITLAVILGVTTGGINLSSLAIVAGALSVGIGFGLQNIVSNFVSGIILLVERPISQGDWIEVGGVHGVVRDISVRSTRVETFDRFDVIVPNSDLVSGQVRNYTKGNVLGRIIVPVGVAYGNDTRKVEKILLSIARQHDMVLMNPAPYVYFKGFGADALEFEIRAILRDVNKGLGVRTEMNHQIAERLAEEGIEIPYAQRDIWLRNPEALTGVPTSVPPQDT